jgi:capsular polysaccharide biosynthesis protein
MPETTTEETMELADLTRVIARYRWLIVACVLAGELIAGVLHYGQPTTYTASTRLVLNTADPESRTEAAVFADTVKAIATSPPRIEEAFAEAHIRGQNIEDVAGRVSVRALGSSGIIQISVRDANSVEAALVANALAAEVIETRLDVATGDRTRVLRELDRRTNDLNRRISVLDARIAPRPNGLPAAERQRDFLMQQRAAAEAERVGLLASDALNPRPTVISRASAPLNADESRLLPDLMLGALLGLVVGIGIAGLLELLRSTVSGGSDLARAFDAPLLGTLGQSRVDADSEATGIAARLALSAEAAGVTTVNLLAVGRPADLDAIAFGLQAGSVSVDEAEEEDALAWTAEGQAAGGKGTTAAARGGRGARIAPVDPSGLSLKPFGAASASGESERKGLVVVTPLAVNKREIEEAVKLIERTSLPLLGLIATAPPQQSRMRRAPNSLAEPRPTA